jgi:hypothetical protein
MLAAGVTVLALAVQTCGPASASTHVPSRYFGMHAPALIGAFPKAPVGAVDLTTNGVYWPQLETSKGVFNWARLDSIVNRARAHGAKPLLVLGQTPGFHSTTPQRPAVSATVPEMAAWRTYVRHVVRRYHARIDYQIWPEANITENWSGTSHQLARLVVAAAKIIHRTSPSAKVVSPAMVLRLPYQQRAMSRFFATRVGGLRVGHYVDAVGIDPYPVPDGSPEDSAALIRMAHRIVAANRVRAPLWNLEINYGVAGGHVSVPAFTAAKQASYVVRTFLLNAAARVKRVYWLGWSRIGEVGIQMVQRNGVTRTAAGRAYATVERWMLGQRAPSCERRRGSHLYACKMVRAGQVSWVYWTTRGTAVVRAPTGSRHLQRVRERVRGAHAGQRILVTTAPVRVYH